MSAQAVDLREENPVRNMPWTSAEVAQLRELAPLGAVVAAAALRRSVKSVQEQARRQRISLRRPGERKGRVLGQATGIQGPVVDRLRDAIAAGEVDGSRVVHLVELAAAGAPICPTCGREPVETPAGLGMVCHLRELTHAHELEVDRINAARALAKARQRKHRAKGRAS